MSSLSLSRACSELKVAGAIALTYDEFYAVFGECDDAKLRELYPRMRAHLTSPSRTYWDKNYASVKNIMYSGSSGVLAFVVFRVVLPLIGLGWLRQACLDRLSASEFQALCDKHATQLRLFVWLVDRLHVFGAALAGVPVRQLMLAGARDNSFAIVAERVFYQSDFCRDNYFFLGYLLGKSVRCSLAHRLFLCCCCCC